MSLCVNHSTGDIPRRLCGVAGAARAGRRGQTAAAAACAAAAHGADRTGGALCPGAAGPIEHQDQQSGQPAPRVRHYDWNGAVQPLVGQMLQASGVNAGSILLVDSVNNRTNGSLNAGEATTALRSALAGNGKFTPYRRSSWRSPSSSWACRRRTALAAAAKPWASPATWARSMCFTQCHRQRQRA